MPPNGAAGAPKLKAGVLAPLPAPVVLAPKGLFCAELVLAVPNSDGDEAPLEAPPRLPNKPPPVVAVGVFDPKIPPLGAPVDDGALKENPPDMFFMLRGADAE